MIATLLAEGWTHVEVATAMGCSTKTIQRWMKVPEQADKVREQRRVKVAAVTARLESLGPKALQQLDGLLSVEDDSLRLQVVKTVLTMGRQHHREEMFEEGVFERLAVLEAQASGLTPVRG